MGEIRTLVAFIAPVESAAPVTTTQSLTARALDVADWTWVYLVDAVNPMVTEVLGAAVEAVAEPVVSVPSITSEVALTELTLPLAKPKVPAPPDRDPFDRLGKPPDPPPKPLPAPTAPFGQAPDVVGWLIVTIVAASRPLELVPLTITQSLGASDEAATLDVLVNAVDGVQLTVT